MYLKSGEHFFLGPGANSDYILQDSVEYGMANFFLAINYIIILLENTQLSENVFDQIHGSVQWIQAPGRVLQK